MSSIAERLNIPPGLAEQDPPADWPWKSGCWLIARHPMAAQLLARIPGAVHKDGDPDFRALADAINFYDEGESGVSEDADLDRAAQDADAFAVMSSGEKQMLRALAVLASRVPIRWSVASSFSSVSDRGFVKDWLQAAVWAS